MIIPHEMIDTSEYLIPRLKYSVEIFFFHMTNIIYLCNSFPLFIKNKNLLNDLGLDLFILQGPIEKND